ncbi:hypothetical protein E2C01_027110 [Portunus trituberculatus]|uniref:Uncharacterized protein n=1 Tax=Portunus trituberculatus TaxID=210409 RepID=A0A5B7EH23_PORTR|nr:hypothetical protein [Portunus trituberculatus]
MGFERQPSTMLLGTNNKSNDDPVDFVQAFQHNSLYGKDLSTMRSVSDMTQLISIPFS